LVNEGRDLQVLFEGVVSEREIQVVKVRHLKSLVIWVGR
jgi:hypothetical protein